MGTLAAEVKTDLDSDEFKDDLFESVKWGAHSLTAMVDVSGVVDAMAEPGGSTLTAERQFKFRRTDLASLETDITMFGDLIEYNGRKYDVTVNDERPEWPLVVVTGVLRL